MYGAYIRAARERSGLSPSDMARSLGYADVSSVTKIERDAANISLQQLDKMAEVMGVPIGDLLPNSGGSPVEDLFNPLIAAMSDLTSTERRDLILDLAMQARICLKWRRKTAQGSKTALPGTPSRSEEDLGELVDTLAGITSAGDDLESSQGEGREVRSGSGRQRAGKEGKK